MAGSVVTTVLSTNGISKGLHIVRHVCTGDAADGGSVPATTVLGLADWFLYSVETVPGTVGDAPTGAYAVTVQNSRGTDLLQGSGAGRSTTAKEIAYPSGAPAIIEGALSITVGSLGNSRKTTLVVVYIKG